MEIIEEDTWVCLEDNRNESKIVKVSEKKMVGWRKHKFDIGVILHKQYNTFWKIDKSNTVVEITSDQFYDNADLDNQIDDANIEITKTNKDLFDFNDSQKLTQEEIIQLKQQKEGEEIVDEVIQNSKTFEQKTEFSKAKYLKRKKEKYVCCFMVLKTTIDNVHKTQFLESPQKLNFMRIDSLAFFMQLSSITQNSNILMFDNANGVVVSAVAERLDGEGSISTVFWNHSKSNLRDYLPIQQMNFNEEILKSIKLIKNLEDIEKNQNKYTHLLIAGEFKFTEIIEKYLNLIAVGGIIVIFSTYLEKLHEVAEQLLSSGLCSKIDVLDSFLRYHQVLENRTHPKVEMNAFGGYLLQTYKLK
ncbi:unnamed protein product [Paramecium primaurelia]|uniref:tRNA (adenine(58)-N(1))-methyltransferase non-catalytic subunit TRM6 n=1 Tax=Paramecium primaurelia TaxID=5886 RepID=A0A8S1JRH7_PARPR|nr:unnamed protein product [Paramecium primaurelia]